MNRKEEIESILREKASVVNEKCKSAVGICRFNFKYEYENFLGENWNLIEELRDLLTLEKYAWVNPVDGDDCVEFRKGGDES